MPLCRQGQGVAVLLENKWLSRNNHNSRSQIFFKYFFLQKGGHKATSDLEHGQRILRKMPLCRQGQGVAVFLENKWLSLAEIMEK